MVFLPFTPSQFGKYWRPRAALSSLGIPLRYGRDR